MTLLHRTTTLQVKSLSDNGRFSGYASVFGVRDLHNEVVTLGAFTSSLNTWRKKEALPAMLWMHDATQPIGVWHRMHEDKNGLVVEGQLALRTQKGSEAYELLRLRALTGLSIGYRVIRAVHDQQSKTRLLRELDLFEVSLVTFPANESARISDVKSPMTPPLSPSSVMGDRLAARLYRAANILRQPLGSPHRPHTSQR